MALQIGIESVGSKSEKAVGRLSDALAVRGVEVGKVEEGTGEVGGVGAGHASSGLAKIVVFDRPNEDVDHLLAESRANGAERLLTVSVGGAPSSGALWRLLAAGASDVLTWSDDAVAEQVAARLERWAEVDRLLDSPVVRDNLIGESPAWRRALRQLVEIARFSGGGVLVSGETGTGKELAARLIHSLDAERCEAELVLVDCTTLMPELAGSELFGHERGAFTHALAARDGAFSRADGGTLFLDEIGELPPSLQSELLRVVQEGTFKRLGSNTWRRADFRLVCATHRDLRTRGADGRFRRDLYYRLSAWTCHLPTLDERRSDVPLLVRHFLRQLFGDVAPELDPAVLGVLMARDYPGNVRDLRLLTQRIAQRHVGPGPITVGDLPEEERPHPENLAEMANGQDLTDAVRVALAHGQGLKDISNAAADAAVRVALDEADGSVREAAERLGVTPRALQLRRAKG